MLKCFTVNFSVLGKPLCLNLSVPHVAGQGELGVKTPERKESWKNNEGKRSPVWRGPELPTLFGSYLPWLGGEVWGEWRTGEVFLNGTWAVVEVFRSLRESSSTAKRFEKSHLIWPTWSCCAKKSEKPLNIYINIYVYMSIYFYEILFDYYILYRCVFLSTHIYTYIHCIYIYVW